MTTDVEIERALAAITATLNDQQLERFEKSRVEQIVTASLAGETKLAVDDGGGLHDEAGARVAVIRRAPGGQWIAERQNDTADRSDTAVPASPPEGRSPGLLDRLKALGS